MILRCPECKRIITPDNVGRCPLCGGKCELNKAFTAPQKSREQSCHLCGKKATTTVTKKETINLTQDTLLEYIQFIFWPVMAILRILGRNTNYRIFKVKVPICADCKKAGLVSRHSFQKSLYDVGEV